MQELKQETGTGYSQNIYIWLVLLALTAVMTAVAGIDLGDVTILIVLVVAIVQAWFILNYFMNVKQDNKTYRIFTTASIVLLFFFIYLCIH
ncbi:MAG: cytochrome C oxidase subunit IV family protein [Bacteroidetes bacterium]|nr:cytochrome C oxidase subunit IV family protein [Bacteroidota bacterium]